MGEEVHGGVQAASTHPLGMLHAPHEQRGASRQRVHGTAVVLLPSGQVWPGRVFDMSHGGVSVYLDLSLPAGTCVQLQLNIFHNGKGHMLSIAGRSMYALLCSKEGFRNGFEFVRPDAAAQECLAEILA